MARVQQDQPVPDVLPGADQPRLRVLFCGINPGLASARLGQHFARPGNRFWPALHRGGFTEHQLAPAEQWQLARLGLGITNIVQRASARAAELTDEELRAGGERLCSVVRARRPDWLAVLGISAYRVAFAAKRAAVGEQSLRIEGAGVWVLPNPSGLNAHWTPATLAEEFARLHRRVHAAPR